MSIDVPKPWPLYSLRQTMDCTCVADGIRVMSSCKFQLAGCKARYMAIIHWQRTLTTFGATVEDVGPCLMVKPPAPKRDNPTFEERMKMPCACSTTTARSYCMAKARCRLRLDALSDWYRKRDAMADTRQGVLFAEDK